MNLKPKDFGEFIPKKDQFIDREKFGRQIAEEKLGKLQNEIFLLKELLFFLSGDFLMNLTFWMEFFRCIRGFNLTNPRQLWEKKII